MKTQNFDKYFLIDTPSPIQKLANLSRHLGCESIFVKRDDLGGLGGGGGKLRKLEYIIAEAVKQGSDTLVVTGATHSNCARLVAACAAKIGVACELVLAPSHYSENENLISNGNALLNRMFGATTHLTSRMGGLDVMANALISELTRAGKKPYLIPLGATNALGCLGYKDCAIETANQSRLLNIRFDRILMPNGSGGIQAGFVAGQVLQGLDPRTVIGISVYQNIQTATATTFRVINETLNLLNSGITAEITDVIIDDSQLRLGYGIPDDATNEAIFLFGRLEGLILDPVYSGKAAAALLENVKSQKYDNKENILLLLTGGAPSTFAYSDFL